MTNVAKALYTFLSSFELPAYEENTVPDNAAMPYITYPIISGSIDDENLLSFRVWYRTTDISKITDKVDDIENAIGEGAALQTYTNTTATGQIFITKGSPFCQILTDEDKTVKYAYINTIIRCYTK